ncbi:LCP family protein [Streptomyces sp. NBC_01190]|uniref:LCP family protein n=1 Tax=Streptomyces sp. NBC_01190 TaxID=2903767 RepID=UPI003869CE76|nr:LCP family protein [Streptomyces sp. NBC_01190]
MDRQGRRNIDPADQWVLDPATGTYQLRLDPEEPSSPSVPAQGNYGETVVRSAEPPPPPAGPTSYGEAYFTPGTPGPPGPLEGPAPLGFPEALGPSGTPAVPTAAGLPTPAATAAIAVPARPARRPVTALTGPRSRRRPRQKTSRRHRALAWTGGAVGLVLIAGTIGGYLLYQHFNDNITTIDVGDAGSRSVTHEGPMNILIIGTDSRQGLGSRYGDTGSVGHADTTILFHVSAARNNATALSIPRDIVTGIPDCPTKQRDGSTKVVPGTPARVSTPRFNESLGQDGRDPGCTMRLVSRLTGLRIDHFMMVDFEAVKTLSTAVGGVNVCLARPLVDPKSHLDLRAGPHLIKGEQALEFVRTRHALRNQSDLDRIKLQQNFISAMIRKVKSSGTLTSPSKLWTLADAATRALTVDTAIGSVSRLSSLAEDLSRVDTRHITFTTLPVRDNPDEKVRATVVVDQVKAASLLSLIRRDVSLTQGKKASGAPDPRLVGAKAAPSDTRVGVFNGSGVFGAAQDTVNWLRNEQRVNRSANSGNAPVRVARTTLEYAPNQADQARSLAAMMGLPAAALKEGAVDARPLAYMRLTLGADFTRPGAPIGTPTAVPDGVQRTEADSRTCVG